MIQISTISELKDYLIQENLYSQNLILVPTMGNLHEGHLSIINEAQKYSQNIAVSIFINPLQFGPNEDLLDYPRTLSEDLVKLKSIGCRLVFTPSVGEFQFNKMQIINTGSKGKILCGVSRPTHFDGVATIVKFLLELFQPSMAFFGKKDYQQLAVIKDLVKNFSIPCEIKGVTTYREESGLAKSSRNQYLTNNEIKVAPFLYAFLLEAKKLLKIKNNNFSYIESFCKEGLEGKGFKVDYFKVCSENTLMTPSKEEKMIVCAAASLGKTRLIDNIEIM